MKRICPAAHKIILELQADIATEKYRKTKSHRDYIRMQDARTKALGAR